MVWEKKVWGRVWHLFNSDQSAVSFLQLIQGTCCSRHSHEERANLFAIVSGQIAIQSWNNGCLSEVILHSGQTHTISSGIVHRFRVLESSEIVEVYWSDVPGGKVRIDDIKRLDKGGLDINRGGTQGGMR